MTTSRLEAFSDGVLAIIITIMVLGMPLPKGVEWASLKPILPNFIGYLLSFVYVGIYWNNHHHMMNLAEKVNGKTLWYNLHLLFWLSLLPFATGWMGENNFDGITVIFYGIILLMSAVAWLILARGLGKVQENEKIRQAYGKDGKTKLSILVYLVGIVVSFFNARIGLAFFYLVAFLWIIPDLRVEKIAK